MLSVGSKTTVDPRPTVIPLASTRRVKLAPPSVLRNIPLSDRTRSTVPSRERASRKTPEKLLPESGFEGLFAVAGS